MHARKPLGLALALRVVKPRSSGHPEGPVPSSSVGPPATQGTAMCHIRPYLLQTSQLIEEIRCPSDFVTSAEAGNCGPCYRVRACTGAVQHPVVYPGHSPAVNDVTLAGTAISTGYLASFTRFP